MSVTASENAIARYCTLLHATTPVVVSLGLWIPPWGSSGGVGVCRRLAARRITQEHRLVYAVEDDQIVVLAARFHYGE
ncbi:MAG: type II toxin-antitoxin system YoeB family toxin [Actinobacteria bacterium]|nr:type II toxin-antitoxin system YoeB family toxin [Actinomycetota bacterium]